jgi:hypothetical protein
VIVSLTNPRVSGEKLKNMEAEESRVHRGISSLPPRTKSTVSLALRRWYLVYVLLVLLDEIGALGHRIRCVLRIREVEFLSCKDSTREWIRGCAMTWPYTHVRTRYMQQIEAENPFLSIAGRLLLSQEWKVGLEYGLHMDRPQNQDGMRS